MRTLTVAAAVESLVHVNALVHELAVESELDPDAAYRLRLATEELFVNVVQHGAGRQERAVVRLAAEVTADGEVRLRIIDTARPFEPFGSAATCPPPAAREPGGLGLYLVRDAVDGASYEYTDGANRTTIVVRRRPATEDGAGRCPKAR